MDKRVFRMAVLAILSAFILVMVIVYVTNADKINELFGRKTADSESSEAATSYVSMEDYGDQIGNDLDGFMGDEDFFDDTEKIPSVVVIKKSSSSATDDSADAGILANSGDMPEPDDRSGTGMAVVGELTNPNAYMSGYEYNGVMPTAPEGSSAPNGAPGPVPGNTQVGTPVGN